MDAGESLAPSGLRVTFLGVSTLLLDDGESAVMTDGFFSRPSLYRVVRSKIAPDDAVIDQCLERAGVKTLAAVVPVHSHYDHVFDAPVVAERMGALLVGSSSTANVGRGYGLTEERIRVVRAPETIAFGRFGITFIRAEHSPHALYPGEIEGPITPPAYAREYAEGECYSFAIEHGSHRILIHASAGFIPGALDGCRADVVYLGVGALGKLGREHQEAYWREVVAAVGARRVIVIHWDDFWRPLSDGLVPQPRFADDFDVTMQFLLERGNAAGVDVRIPEAWAAADPFASLPSR